MNEVDLKQLKKLTKTRHDNFPVYASSERSTSTMEEELHPMEPVLDEWRRIQSETELELFQQSDSGDVSDILRFQVDQLQQTIRALLVDPNILWIERCPKVLTWPINKQQKKKQLLTIVDPQTAEERFENPKEYVDRVLTEAGVTVFPSIADLRKISPKLYIAFYNYATKNGQKAADLLPQREYRDFANSEAAHLEAGRVSGRYTRQSKESNAE